MREHFGCPLKDFMFLSTFLGWVPLDSMYIFTSTPIEAKLHHEQAVNGGTNFTKERGFQTATSERALSRRLMVKMIAPEDGHSFNLSLLREQGVEKRLENS